MNKNQLFTAHTKMADMIASNPNLLIILPRLNIPLGFGEKTIAEVCESRDISVNFFLMICNIYTFDKYLPTIDQLEQADMQLWVPYLRASHDYYSKERLPHIKHHLDRITDRLGGKYADVLKRFFADYCKEVSSHFESEEKLVFPYIDQLLSDHKPEKHNVVEILEPHDSIMDRLYDLTKIVYKYIPGDIVSEELMDLIFCVHQLADDLQKHALIEEKILLPYVERLEGEGL